MIGRRRGLSTELGTSEKELRRQTSALEELHQDQSLPALRSSIEEWVETNRERTTRLPQDGVISRRGLLVGAGAVAVGGAILAACGSGNGSSTTTSTTSSGGPSSLTGDLAVAGTAASLENLGVFAYGAGIKAAQQGKLGAVPPAVVTFAETAMSQHQQHAAAWNAVLTGSGKKAVTETDPALTPTVNQMLAQVTDVGGLAKLALEIENIAAQTYQASITKLSSAKAIQTAASIHPVEMQHAAILNLVLGMYPVPNAFNPTNNGRSPSDIGAH